MNLLVFLCLFTMTPPPQYASIFGEEYSQALDFYQTHKTECKSWADVYQTDNALMTAVVFPEWIRYSSFRDFFETEALELAYSQYGTEAADFSIGYCQMKPSFAENIEMEISKNSFLSQKYSALIPEGKTTEQRKERLENLKSLKMQWVYLACFMEIVREKYPETEDFTTEEKVKFYATVYNTGWQKSSKAIVKQMEIASYPYGNKVPETFQYIYAEVALDFYLNAR
ncbi:MAG: hypothetical protein K1X92_03585 [Bacteroidia bacterium]|nr:hypothetical protein [Bacteroidia bacterium]